MRADGVKGTAYLVIESDRLPGRVRTVIHSAPDGASDRFGLIGAMQGDDHRWVLYGLESVRPGTRSRNVIAQGWLGWYDGETFRTAHGTCDELQPE